MDISFVIVSYNSVEPLKICLESLFESIGNDLDFEVIVVDNDSKDGSANFVKENYPEIKLIKNNGNLGYTKAMNQGLRHGKGRYLVQINPDVFVYPDTFQALMDWMNEHQDVGICTPKILNQDATLQKQCRRSFARPVEVFAYFLKLDRIFPNHRIIGNYLKTYLIEDEIAQVEAVSGSCMMIRKDVLAQIGYLDERYFAYQEDTDFCFRANQVGWKVFYLPFAKVMHQGGKGGSRTEPYKAILEWHRSYFLYYRKNLAKDYFFIVNWTMYLMIGLKLIFALVGAFFSKEKIVGSKKP